MLQSGMDRFQNVDFDFKLFECFGENNPGVFECNCIKIVWKDTLQTQLKSEPLSSAWAVIAFLGGLFQNNLMLTTFVLEILPKKI